MDSTTGDDTMDSSDTEDSGSTGGDATTGDPMGDAAVGTINLGESHPAVVGDTLAVLNASFIPNSTTTAMDCRMDVDGCLVSVPPMCANACVVPAVCSFNDQCMPECIEPCALMCAEGQECYYPLPGVQSCRDIETFDAGRLDFFSTTQPISLFPPYQLPPDTVGALVAPDKEVTVMATGSAGAGFGPFEAAVTTSESIFTNLDEILPADAFGTGPLNITWMPGVDEVTVNIVVTGATLTGSVSCEADDTMGMFAVPRTAIDAAIPMETPTQLDVSVQRTHSETTTGVDTVGTLLNDELLPMGRIDFNYLSIETQTLVP
jgi:hypothetical protein